MNLRSAIAEILDESNDERMVLPSTWIIQNNFRMSPSGGNMDTW